MEWMRADKETKLEVSRFPTTVADYSLFIESEGYLEKKYWSKRGWKWRHEHEVYKPKYWGAEGYANSSLPITGVSFWEAEAYSKFMHARLPNELEWYFVASNGQNDPYPWGNAVPTIEHANLAFFGAISESRRWPVNRTSRSASLNSVCDMLGNVSEWCLPDNLRKLPNDITYAVHRGGACWHSPSVVDNKFRDCVRLDTRDNQTGIRLVRGGPPKLRSRLTYKRTNNGFFDIPGVANSSLRRPTKVFRQEGLPDALSEENWRLSIEGDVANPLSLTLHEIREHFPSAQKEGMFFCVCRWADITSVKGVLLESIIAAAKPKRSIASLYLHQRSIVGKTGRAYTSCIPLRDALERQAILCYEMNGKKLTLDLGWPLRLIDFNLYGYKQVKCLESLIISDRFELGWWEKEAGYDPEGRILPGDFTVVGKSARGYSVTEKK